MDYSGSKTKGRHITRSANTRVNVRKGLSNRERLRQRGLTYAQNQNGYLKPDGTHDTDVFNDGRQFNGNVNFCTCDADETFGK